MLRVNKLILPVTLTPRWFTRPTQKKINRKCASTCKAGQLVSLVFALLTLIYLSTDVCNAVMSHPNLGSVSAIHPQTRGSLLTLGIEGLGGFID